MKRFFLKFLPVIILTILIVWAGKGIFKYNVFSTHDGEHHFARSFDAIATFSEGNFPLRWAGSLNYGCGVPIYNFFYPLIYYFVIILNFATHNIFTALAIIDFASLAIGTLFFYLWMKKETDSELGALGSAILYLYAPYRFSLIFVRGSPEFIAYAILPVVLYSYSLFFKAGGRRTILYALLAALTGGFLTISHNFTVMFLMPIILAYLIIKLFLLRSCLKTVVWTFAAYISAFGFGAFFVGPAVFEKGFTKIGSNFLQWREHFPTLGQMIRSRWGYFYSSYGTANDGMSFMLGYAQWVVLGLAAIWIAYFLIKAKKTNIWVVFFFIMSLVAIYLILPWSIPVWEKIKPLQEIQFSWRILGIAIFAISALFGFLISQIKNKKIVLVLFIGVSVLAVYGNRNHLLPQPVSSEDIYRYDDFEKLHPHRYSTTTLGDDVVAASAGGACWFTTELISTEGNKNAISYKVSERGNTFGSVRLTMDKNQFVGDKLMMGLGYFPGAYRFEANGQVIESFDCGGLNCISTLSLKNGENFLSWRIKQTPIQSFFNNVTLLFLAIWIVVVFFAFRKKKLSTVNLAVITVFVLFAFLRFYNLEKRIGFGWDNERDALAVKSILQGDLKLIGPRVLADTGFFLPPYFFYLLAPFYALSNLSPYATVYFLIFYNLIFFVVSFLILKKLFSQKVALLFLAFWAINPHTLSFDTVAWNPLLVPLAFVIFLYLLARSKSFLLGLVWGVGVSFHIQFFLLAPIVVPFILKDKKRVRNIIWGFALTFAPLVLFDLRNNFLNLKLASDFLLAGGARDYFSFLPVWDNVVARTFGMPISRLFSVFFYFLIAGVLYVWRKKPAWRGLFYTWLFFPLAFAFYGKRPSEYYFNFSLVIVGLVFAKLVSLKSKLLFFIVLLLLVHFGLKASDQLRETPLGLYQKDKIAQFLAKITKDTSPFNLSYSVGLGQDVGFRYLFDYRGVKLNGNDFDPLMQIVIPPQKNTFVIDRVGLEIPKGWLDANWAKREN